MIAGTLFPVAVVERRVEADGVVSLALAPTGAADLPRWSPGAHIDLHTPSGRVRKYSLCGDPADRRCYRIAVLRQGDAGVSAEIHDRVHPGAELPVSGPHNHFPQVDAGAYLFLAGGIGVTPFLPMIARAEALGRPWRLHYVGRTRAGMAYLDHLAAFGCRTRVTATSESGRPDLAAEIAALSPGEIAYCCGPEAMMAAAVEAARAAGHPERLKIERFGAPAPDPAADAENAPFEVVIASTGQVLAVPADRPLGEVLSDAGVSCGLTCGEGYCGSCVTRVLDGEPDHRDTFLTPEERAAGEMMVCVGRARGPRLVLDL